MILAVQDRQLLFWSKFHLLESSQIQDTIQNVNLSFIIYKTIQHVGVNLEDDQTYYILIIRIRYNQVVCGRMLVYFAFLFLWDPHNYNSTYSEITTGFARFL